MQNYLSFNLRTCLLQGTEFIEKIIGTWELSPESWDFRVEFLRIQPSPNQSQYLYNVIFTPTNPSLRTKRKIQVSKKIPVMYVIQNLVCQDVSFTSSPPNVSAVYMCCFYLKIAYVYYFPPPPC